MNIFFSAGEVSGDMIAARIAAELRRRDGEARLWGLGGDRMRNAGVELLRTTTDLGRVGVSESFSAIGPLLRAFNAVRREVLREKPTAAILVANDVFNAILGWWLRRRGVETIAVFPPQVWIWRAILGWFARGYDVVAASFPEEQERYTKHTRTVFVGHYLADVLPAGSPGRRSSHERVIGLLPGSRRHEIETLLPMLLETARRLYAEDPSLRFVMPIAGDAAAAAASAAEESGLPLSIVDDSHVAMRSCDLLLLASGTATLEAALIGTPMVVLYRVSWLTIHIVRLAIRLGLMDSETIALPNLLLGERVVPEISQERLTVENITTEARALLRDEARMARMRRDLVRVRDVVETGDTIGRICDLVLVQEAMGDAACR